MTPDPYLIYVDAAGHLAPVTSTASGGTVLLSSVTPPSSTGQPESGFHTNFKAVTTEPSGPVYATEGHEDYVTVTLEVAVAGLCILRGCTATSVRLVRGQLPSVQLVRA
jgi:hypothetical protein